MSRLATAPGPGGLVAAVPRRPISLGYASIQFSPKFAPPSPDIWAQIDAAADAGYGWIALDRHTVAHAQHQGSLAELAAACRDRLPCRELQALVVTDDLQQLRTDADQLAAQAAVFDAPLVLTCVKAAPTPAVLRALGDAVGEIADARPGVRIGIEFSPLFSVATIPGARELCARLGRSELGLIVDAWHFFHAGGDWSALQALPLEQLLMVHFSDHGPLGDGGIQVDKDRRRLPGQGDFPLRRFVAAIRDLGYDSDVEIEVVSETHRSLSARDWSRLTLAAGAPYWN